MRTVKELSAEANRYTFSTEVSFRNWEHVLVTILHQARELWAHHDLEDAYILYLRWADLTLNKLPLHPQFEANKERYDKLAIQLGGVLKEAEKTKTSLAKSAQLPQVPGGPRVPRAEPQVEPRPLKPLGTAIGSFQGSQSPEPIDLSSLDLTTLRSLKSQPVLPSSPPPVEPLKYSLASSPPAKLPLNSAIEKIPPVEEDGESLRRVFVPESLEAQFLRCAESNTRQNLETCGILCGKLTRNAYFVTDLVIPNQESTPDSCQTTHEEELFGFVESKNIFILGWIHTHPTQSCFMSSVDLHTHNSYQIMLAEAVAIVCSPQHTPSWGAFRLTQEPGMRVVRNCSERGFHPHNERGIYKSAIPGHMRLLEYEVAVRDLRAE